MIFSRIFYISALVLIFLLYFPSLPHVLHLISFSLYCKQSNINSYRHSFFVNGTFYGIACIIQVCLHMIIVLLRSPCTTFVVFVYRTWENFGERLAIRQNFPPPIFINARVFNKLLTDSPNFSSPKTLESLICQNFPPPKFSHVRYTHFVVCKCLRFSI